MDELSGFQRDLENFKRWAEQVFLGVVQQSMDEVDDLAKSPEYSVRWLAISLGLVVFFYEFASPILQSQKSAYVDLRFGILLWLFSAALLHTPIGSTEVEDHPSFLFVSVFITLLVVTHISLAMFTVVHHFFAWFLGLIFPKLAETIWVPALRSVRSFKNILKASIFLSGSLSFLFAYCVTIPNKAASSISSPMGKKDCINTLNMSDEQCTVFLNKNDNNNKNIKSNDTIAEYICIQLLPQLEDIWGSLGSENDNFHIHIFGVDFGRLSLLESPIGLLWLSGIAIWATYYTLRRTKRINQSIIEREKRLNKSSREKMEDIDDEESEDEYVEDDHPTEDSSQQSSGSNRRRKNDDEVPKNFLPMAEWYSLAVTETAFQFLISMKLFLGRFDMRTMQAALEDSGMEDENYVRGKKQQRSRILSSTSIKSTSVLDELENDDEQFENSFCSSKNNNNDDNNNQADSNVKHYDTRFADLDEIWFDWIADTGDGGNSTYTVARAVAQPSLQLAAFDPEKESENLINKITKKKKNKSNDEKQTLETLKRGDFLFIGGDLAYPTPTKQEYDRRLFVPFEYAMEPPPSYHRDDISTTKHQRDNVVMSSRLSFLKGIAPTAHRHDILAYSFPYAKNSPPSSSSSSSFMGSGGINNKSNGKDKKKQQVTSCDDSLIHKKTIGGIGTEGKLLKKQPSEIFQIGGSTESLDSSAFDSCYEEDHYADQTDGEEDINDDDDEEEDDGPKIWKGAPCCYAIPGNHDWFDGLDTFMQCICYRDWMGGWRLPQTRSYFAMELPHGWWLFALDFALEEDIDGLQYQYFASIASDRLEDDDKVILCCHEPTWLLDAYMNCPHPEDKPFQRSAKNLKQLMRRHLRGKVALRIAGDVHNYIRHDAVQPLSHSALRAGAAPVLLTAGGGGAFLHPTHTFPSRFKETGAYYERKCCYPSILQSRTVGVQNIGGFRTQNWKFDIVGSTAYFLMVVSFFPRCRLDHIMQKQVYPDGIMAFFNEVVVIFSEIWTDSVISLIVTLFTFLATFSFADYHHGGIRRAVIGSVHVAAHVMVAIVLFLLLEIVVEVSIQDGLAGQGYDSCFQSFQNFERKSMPSAWWTTGYSEVLLRFMLRVFDLPENMATTRVKICSGQVEQPGLFSTVTQLYTSVSNSTNPLLKKPQLTRFDLFGYYLANFLYLYTIAAEFVAMVLGLYLYICVNFFDLMWNEAYSSIRCPDFKSFVRFRIDETGDLHTYVIGIDKSPRKWRRDHRWSSTWTRLLRKHFDSQAYDLDELDPSIASYGAEFPSKWIPQYTRKRKLRKQQEPKIVDYFVIPKAPKQKWVKAKRGNSTINEKWWEPFNDLEQRKVFRKAPSSMFLNRNGFMSGEFDDNTTNGSNSVNKRRRSKSRSSPFRGESKSQSPVGNRLGGNSTLDIRTLLKQQKSLHQQKNLFRNSTSLDLNK